MGAKWASFSNPDPELTSVEAVAPAAVVPVDAGEHGSTFAAIGCARLDAGIFVDVEGASRAQRRLVRQLVPIEQRIVGAPPELQRLQPWPALAQHFSGCSDQELLHSRLRVAVLPAGPALPATTPTMPATTSHATALVIVDRDDRCPRAMTPRNLRAVLATLSGFNRRARSRAGRVSNVLLYGWVRARELAALRAEFGDELRLRWLPGLGLEGDPPATRTIGGEAASLATFAALQRRYRDDLVAIGFASATLDAVALIGIPSFYFDETTADQWLDCYRDGRYLIDARCDVAVDERRLGLTRAINTFIRINVRSAWLDEAALADLMSALHVWMLRGLTGCQRNWSHRVRLSRSGLAALPFARVRAQCLSEARQVMARLSTSPRGCPRSRRGSAGAL
jgi:hypothetical protein